MVLGEAGVEGDETEEVDSVETEGEIEEEEAHHRDLPLARGQMKLLRMQKRKIQRACVS